MSDAAWLMTACAVAWLGIGAYLLHLARRTAALEARLRDLEEEADTAAPGIPGRSTPDRQSFVETVSSPLPDAERDDK
ncbi:CcmD family protein [Desulfovibrio sp. OttesenSCG-928-I05]|nr:CcmD family protein [Desulfovibrio sp. OttesenSCG-928-I05]